MRVTPTTTWEGRCVCVLFHLRAGVRASASEKPIVLESVHVCLCAVVYVLTSIRLSVLLGAYDWSLTTQLSTSQMVRMRMPAWWFFQPQLGPEWLSEILEELEDRMRHKLVLLAKDNGTDMQLSNLISETCREHSDLDWGQEHVLLVAKKALAEPCSIWRSGMTHQKLHNREKHFIYSPCSNHKSPNHCLILSGLKGSTYLLAVGSE